MNNLQEILDQASFDISRLKHPDLDAFREAFSPIVNAACGHSFDRDSIESIDERSGTISDEAQGASADLQ